MIKFFRHIRQNLIDTDKTARYFKYAIGEIFLVVIGILIALSINTWNQNRLNAQLEQELLNNLLSDIQTDILNIQFIDSLATIALISKNRILNFIDGEELSRDSVFYFMSKLSPQDKFIPTTITYDEMKNSDGFKVIQSKMLRREISILYHTYKKLEEVDKAYYDSRSKLHTIRMEDFSTGSLTLIGRGVIRDQDQIIKQIKTNRRFINSVESSNIIYRYAMYKETLEAAFKFREKLEDYIKHN